MMSRHTMAINERNTEEPNSLPFDWLLCLFGIVESTLSRASELTSELVFPDEEDSSSFSRTEGKVTLCTFALVGVVLDGCCKSVPLLIGVVNFRNSFSADSALRLVSFNRLLRFSKSIVELFRVLLGIGVLVVEEPTKIDGNEVVLDKPTDVWLGLEMEGFVVVEDKREAGVVLVVIGFFGLNMFLNWSMIPMYLVPFLAGFMEVLTVVILRTVTGGCSVVVLVVEGLLVVEDKVASELFAVRFESITELMVVSMLILFMSDTSSGSNSSEAL